MVLHLGYGTFIHDILPHHPEERAHHVDGGEISEVAKPVMFPPGRSNRGTMPLATGSFALAKTIRIVRVARWTAAVTGVEDVGVRADQLLRERSAILNHIRESEGIP